MSILEILLCALIIYFLFRKNIVEILDEGGYYLFELFPGLKNILAFLIIVFFSVLFILLMAITNGKILVLIPLLLVITSFIFMKYYKDKDEEKHSGWRFVLIFSVIVFIICLILMSYVMHIQNRIKSLDSFYF